jgi:hypothetical protein
MAGKKPAKPMAGQSKQVVQDPEIFGSLIKFYGSKDAYCICSQCSKKIARGMVRARKDLFFCSSTCAKVNYESFSQAN